MVRQIDQPATNRDRDHKKEPNNSDRTHSVCFLFRSLTHSYKKPVLRIPNHTTTKTHTPTNNKYEKLIFQHINDMATWNKHKLCNSSRSAHASDCVWVSVSSVFTWILGLFFSVLPFNFRLSQVVQFFHLGVYFVPKLHFQAIDHHFWFFKANQILSFFLHFTKTNSHSNANVLRC